MYTYELKAHLEQAETTLRAADNCANDIAYLLRGRLRKGVSQATLTALKKELAMYNLKTGKWRGQ